MKFRNLITSGLFLLFSLSANAEKYALLIGIDDYPDGISDLKGCVNDTFLIEHVLKKKFNYSGNNIVRLTNSQATKDNIIKHIRSHLGKAKANDSVVLTYSGHGTYVPDLNNDEPGSPRDESIVNYDFDEDEPNTWLVDDIIQIEIKKLKSKNVTIVFDMCHAGTADRSIQPGNTAEKAERYQRFPFSDSLSKISVAHTKQSRSTPKSSQSNYLFIGSSSASETSLETTYSTNIELPGLNKKGKCGLFTLSFVSALMGTDPNTSMKDLFESTSRKTAASATKQYDHDQTPTMAGSFKSSIKEQFDASGASTAQSETTPPVNDPTVSTSVGDHSFKVKINKNRFKLNESVRFKIEPTQPGYFYIFNADTKGNIYRVFPSKFDKTELFTGKSLRIPNPLSDYRMIASELGPAAFRVVFSKTPLPDLEGSYLADGRYKLSKNARDIKTTDPEYKQLKGGPNSNVSVGFIVYYTQK